MKKFSLQALCSLAMIIVLISGCTPPSESNDLGAEEIAQTLVAVAMTQTAMASVPEIETEVPEPQATEVPEEPATQEPTAIPTSINHQIIPTEPGVIRSRISDANSSHTAHTNAASHGDDFNSNLYERPFTENDMVYRPDIDIIRAELSEDSNFYYVTIYLHDTHPEGELQAAYAVEIDQDMDGRGDLLIIVDRPTSTSWDIEGVSVWKDSNNDVGGTRILRPDTNYTGDGYDQEIFSINVLDDPDTAWARVSADSQPSVTLAFKRTLLPRDAFVWGVWAADELLLPSMFDHHDHFTIHEAGSPLSWHTAYPLKALDLIDNTCREAYNFTPTTAIPGLCTTQPPQATNTPAPETPAPETPTLTPEPQLGIISVVAFDDMNNDGVRQPGEPLTIYANPPYGITISVHPDSCASPAIASTSFASYSFFLFPGTYCVRITNGYSMTTPNSYTVTLSEGETIYLAFGFRTVI